MVVRIPTRQQLQSALVRLCLGITGLYMLFSILHYFLLYKYDFLYRMIVYAALSTPLLAFFIGNIRRFRRSHYPKRQIKGPLFVGPVRPRDVLRRTESLRRQQNALSPRRREQILSAEVQGIFRENFPGIREMRQEIMVYTIYSFFNEFRAQLISNHKIELCRNFKFVFETKNSNLL
jgi:hypothetical protein